MAEFVDVMKTWRRMCDANPEDDMCQTCPLDGTCDYIWEVNMNILQEMEDKIMEWGREHPQTGTIREALKMCLRDAHCHGLCPYSGKDNCRGHLLADALRALGSDG